MLYKILDKACENLYNEPKNVVAYIYLDKECKPFGLISACKKIVDAFCFSGNVTKCESLSNYLTNMESILGNNSKSKLSRYISTLKSHKGSPVSIRVLPEFEIIPANVPVLQIECNDSSLAWLVEPIAECIREELERLVNERNIVSDIYEILFHWTGFCNASDRSLSNLVVSLDRDENVHPWGIYFNNMLSYNQGKSLMNTYNWGNDDIGIFNFISKKTIDKMIEVQKVLTPDGDAELIVLENIFKNAGNKCCVEYAYTKELLLQLKETVVNRSSDIILKDVNSSTNERILDESVQTFDNLKQAENVFKLHQYDYKCEYFYCQKEGSYYRRLSMLGTETEKLDVDDLPKSFGFIDMLEEVFGSTVTSSGFKLLKHVIIYIDFINNIKSLKNFMGDAVKTLNYSVACFKFGFSLEDFKSNSRYVTAKAETSYYNGVVVEGELGGLQMIVKTKGVYTSIPVDKILGTLLEPVLDFGETSLRKDNSNMKSYSGFVNQFRV